MTSPTQRTLLTSSCAGVLDHLRALRRELGRKRFRMNFPDRSPKPDIEVVGEVGVRDRVVVRRIGNDRVERRCRSNGSCRAEARRIPSAFPVKTSSSNVRARSSTILRPSGGQRVEGIGFRVVPCHRKGLHAERVAHASSAGVVENANRRQEVGKLADAQSQVSRNGPRELVRFVYQGRCLLREMSVTS